MEKERTHCIRCGKCCILSSPTLQAQDLCLVEGGAIAAQNLYTIRKGELVRDNVMGALVVTREEMIKVREKGGGSCIYYNPADRACDIYENRPAQCSAMACWETGLFMEVYRGPKLSRSDLIRDPVLTGLFERHESRCSYEAMEERVKRIEVEGDKAIQEIIEVLRFDSLLRPFITQKLQIESKALDFIFGRPMIDTMVMFGLQVERKPDGSYYLTALRKKAECGTQKKASTLLEVIE